MPRYQYDIEILGDKVLSRKLAGMALRTSHMRPYWTAIVRDFRRMMVRQFDTQGRYLNGRTWTPLSQNRKNQKAKQTLDPRILHATRRMRKAFTTGQEMRRMETETTLILQPDIRYASIHQRGSADGHVPKRQIVKLNRMHQRRWARGLGTFIKTGKAEVPNL